jgi:hypothetical protein
MFDATDSAREVKALSMSLEPMLDKCERDSDEKAEKESTPLDEILGMADDA